MESEEIREDCEVGYSRLYVPDSQRIPVKSMSGIFAVLLKKWIAFFLS